MVPPLPHAGEGAERSEAGEGTAVASIRQSSFVAYLQALPLAAVFLLFFAVPIALVVVVSFFGYETYQILIPDFTLDNYREVFSEAVTYRTYLITMKFCAIVWAITAVLGFFIAYFLAFQVRSRTSQMVLLLVCSIPFWTSIVIRMIAWIPLLGRNGLVNRSLLGIGVVDGPQEWLLYSEFAVILGYVHLYTLTMIVPIFNSMVRIDRSLIEAAIDAGASTWQVHVDGHSAAVENRDRDRLDLRHRDGDGRLRHRRRARRRSGRLGRQADRDPALLSAVSAGGRQRDGAACSRSSR